LAYKITYKKSVAKDLRGMGKDQALRILRNIDAELSQNPEKTPALTGRYAGLRKYRIGDYRIIFALLGDEVLVLRIRHRKESYRG
jgi:mRNA interferase RelE/StbE